MKSIGKAAVVLATTALLFGSALPAYAEPTVDEPALGDPGTVAETPVSEQPPSDEPGAEDPVEEDTAQTDPEGNSPAETEAEADPAEAPSVSAENEADDTAMQSLGTSGPDSEGWGTTADGGVASGTPNSRIAGTDRYATAAAVSKHGYPSTTGGTVIVATGTNFPDSLSAAPLAAKLRAPLLLTTPSDLPSATRTEITRLKPKTIIVIGSAASVSAGVEAQLKPLASSKTITRLQGADRYETSAKIARHGWGTNAPSAFIATGFGYADALSAGAAAGKAGMPVLLVPGTQSKAPASTLAALKTLKTTKLYVAGSAVSVSDPMVTSLRAGTRALSARYAGSDRYDTSAKIANAHFTSAATTYWAKGNGFADALAGAAVAGAKGSPMLLSTPDCVPTTIYDANDRLKPSNTYLLGSADSLRNTVLFGDECMKQDSRMTSWDFSGTRTVYSKINEYRYVNKLQGARLADSRSGYPALTWSLKMAADNYMRLDPNPPAWAARGGVVKNPTSSNADANAAFAYFKDTYPADLKYRVAGKRTVVSAAWVNRVSGGRQTGWMTIYMGT